MSSSHESVDFKVVGQSILAILIVIAGVWVTEHFLGLEFKRNGLFGLGFLVLGGLVAGRLCSIVGLPSLTGYLFAGLLAGPSLSGVLDQEQVEQLRLVNGLALALIAMHAGSEFTVEMLRKNLKSLIHATWAHIVFIGIGITATLILMRDHVYFFKDHDFATVVSIAVLFSVIAISKSPAAVVAILSETQIKNRLSEHALGIVVILDVVVLIIFSIVMAFTKSTLDPHMTFSLSGISPLLKEILASISAGSFFGLFIAAYFKFIHRNPILFVIAISYGVTALCSYLHYDTLLVFVVAGFVVTNFSKQSEKLIESIEALSSIIMIAFFATAGASLHVEDLLNMWQLVLILFVVRVALTWFSEYTAQSLARSTPDLKKYGFTPFVSQAGLSIGISMIVYERVPHVGPQLATLAISLVTLNEIFGPILFKWGLNRVEGMKESITKDNLSTNEGLQ
ncbi:MAG: cation:proton antiporter [Bdellovibrionaceae bacterium]|nr:cation:proton antiporter [Pseudobdellovibrionaceae bacterium]